NAPAIIDVITERQIRDLNTSDLYEVISSLPGIEMMETYFGRTVLQFRGIMNIHYTNKVLLMVNGSPMYEPVNGAYFLELVPINSIKQIEVIRGPGSSLYGTKAYSGVINIITKKNGDQEALLTGQGSYGSYATFHASASFSKNIDEKSGFYFAGEILNGNGYDYNVATDEKGNSESLRYKNNPIKIHANYHKNNFTMNAGFMHREKMGYGIVPVLSYKGEHVQNMFYINAAYAGYLNPDLKMSLTTRLSSFKNPRVEIGDFPFQVLPGMIPLRCT
ncbi:MAG: TonB-dependent receptor, partial [bacterium]